MWNASLLIDKNGKISQIFAIKKVPERSPQTLRDFYALRIT
jgi:hypothetical protein